MTKRLPMTGQFDPAVLIQTGIRAVISTIFGRFADRREAMAASNVVAATPADAELDYSEEPTDFWFDFLADTGDGWNPTYAMARLVSEDAVKVGGEALPRGRLLLLGGDQVYPSASQHDYQIRFRDPFEAAFTPGGTPRWDADAAEAPHLYAVPGDHDWHDGLSSFLGLFCRRRVAQPGSLGVSRDGAVIAGRRTRQTRSYFALKLPGNWWLWASDSQMEGYIDQPQVDYFSHAAKHWMDPRSRLILCVAEPMWSNVDPERIDERYRSFSYLERLAGLARHPDTNQRMGHELKLILTGDSHHYARHIEHDDDPAVPARQYVTCGGGGAFTSATHQIRDRHLKFDYPRPGVDRPRRANHYPRDFVIGTTAQGERALFPDAATSRRLSWRNLAFPLINPSFTVVLAAIYLVFNWMLSFNAEAAGARNLAEMLGRGSLGDALGAYGALFLLSPWPPVVAAIVLVAYFLLADAPDKPALRLAMGGGHALLQFLSVTLATILVFRLLGHWWDGWLGPAAVMLAAAAAAGIASALVFGLYFIFCMNVLRRQTGIGFSALKIEGYKSFLRLRIAGDGTLVIHAIGLRSVPKDDGELPRDPPLEPHLIEKVTIPA